MERPGGQAFPRCHQKVVWSDITRIFKRSLDIGPGWIEGGVAAAAAGDSWK